MIPDQLIDEVLGTYGLEETQDLGNAIRKYISLLIRWNQRISLTTVTDPIEILKFHFGESLFALASVPILDGRLVDVGSGAGFPGLALAMANSRLHVSLIESDTRKAVFLSEVIRELSLLNVRVARQRMEEIPTDHSGFDFITARALGRYEELLKWSSGRLSDKGRVVLWLGEEDALSLSKEPVWQWGTPIRIPESKKRYLLFGTPPR